VTAVASATTGSKARTPSQHARRARIVEAATELLEDREYERIQIREVAEAAEVALATLYRYFPSKEQLYATVLVTWAESFDPTGGRNGSASATDQARLRAALRRAVRAYERHPNFYRLITALEVVADPAVAELYAQFAARFGGTLRGALRSVADDDADAIAQLTSSFLGSLLRSWSLGKIPIARVYADLDRAVDVIFREPAAAAG
jgi:TetR/AcrR family transcriptional regulator, cholesterol catabolism regulator